MNYRILGRSGVKVSPLGLGTDNFANPTSTKESIQIIDSAIDAGINFIDTAEIYPSPCFEKTYGATEEIIGNWLKEKKNRDKIVLASKIAGTGLSWISGGGKQYSEKNIKISKKK